MRARAAGKLVFVHSSDELYGADRVLLDIVTGLPETWRGRAEVWLPVDLGRASSPLGEALEALGVRTRRLDIPVLRRAYRTPRALLRLAFGAIKLGRRFRAERPAIVYCTTSATLLAAPAARQARVPLVAGHIQEIWTPGDSRVLRPLARCCHRLLAISGPVKASLPEVLQQRTSVVVNSTPAPASLEPLAGHDGPLRFLVASRWNAWKGHRTLLRAWDEAGSPGVLTVLGGPPASGEAVDVPSMVSELKDPESVVVVGEVADPHPHQSAADVVLVPSDNPEPFGLVAIEAFARGRPVVASDAGGVADIVSPGGDGWLFPPGDIQALAEILRGLTREQVTAAGARARNSYEQRYTSARYAAEWSAAVLPQEAGAP